METELKLFNKRTNTGWKVHKHQRNSANTASAPTGCAAAHIHGTTHHRQYDLPTDKKVLKKQPTHKMSSDTQRLKTAYKFTSDVSAIQRNKHSMNGTSLTE